MTPALEKDRPASVGAPEAARMEAAQLKTQQSWDKYVANKLSGGKDGASQAELISTLQRELTQPGMRTQSVPQGEIMCILQQTLPCDDEWHVGTHHHFFSAYLVMTCCCRMSSHC